jgi:hypothetical protein
VPHVVRVSDPNAVEELIDDLRRGDADARRRGARTVVVADEGDDLEHVLRFFLRAWTLSHPAVQLDLESR